MKSLLILIAFSALTFSAVASETCFMAVEKTPKSVPSVFCLETAKLNAETSALTISGSATVPATLKISELKTTEAGKVNFKAEQMIVDNMENICFEGEQATLVVSGTERNGTINPKAMKVAVEYSYWRDTCHSYEQTSSFEYEVVK